MFIRFIWSQRCRCNFKALPVVATLAWVATELDSFEDHERGGLLIEDRYGNNTLQYLAQSSHSSNEEEHNRRIDIACLSQFIQLRQMGLFKLEDIPRYNLVHRVCYQDYFAENTFHFLVDMDPSSLVRTDEEGFLPLHCATQESTIQAFRIVFEYLIGYYPTKKGISSLFTKNNTGGTAFQMACHRHERDLVMEIIEDTLNNSDIPIHTVEALVTAASDEEIDLDCVYLLLRREPHVLARLLPLGPNNNNNNNDDDDDDGGGGDVDDHDNDGDNVDNENHDEEDDDNDEGGDEDVGIKDSKNIGTGTKKRKRRGCSIDGSC